MLEALDQMGLTKGEYIGSEFGARTYKAWDHYNAGWVVVWFYDNGNVFIDSGE